MNHGSLFSGIGGFDLAAQWVGWTNVFNCEWEDFPRRVLKHHFPHVTQHKDIRDLDATTYAGRVDIVSGGFPCQPYSLAGKRKGKDDERHLWPEMLRVVRECAPRYVVGENVRGLVSWNGGMVFEEVCTDLEALGYAVQPFVLPACGVGAPHRRDRVWFVAHTDHKGGGDGHAEVQGAHGEVRQRDNSAKFGNASRRTATNADSRQRQRQDEKLRTGRDATADGDSRSLANSNGVRLEHSEESGEVGRVLKENRRYAQAAKATCWDKFPTVAPVCGGDDGIPEKLDGITFPKWRRESIKAYGNAIVPHVALQIFKAIESLENGTRI